MLWYKLNGEKAYIEKPRLTSKQNEAQIYVGTVGGLGLPRHLNLYYYMKQIYVFLTLSLTLFMFFGH